MNLFFEHQKSPTSNDLFDFEEEKQKKEKKLFYGV